MSFTNTFAMDKTEHTTERDIERCADDMAVNVSHNAVTYLDGRREHFYAQFSLRQPEHARAADLVAGILRSSRYAEYEDLGTEPWSSVDVSKPCQVHREQIAAWSGRHIIVETLSVGSGEPPEFTATDIIYRQQP